MTLPLVLLHGLNNSPAVFGPVTARLDPDWPVVAPHLPVAEDVADIARAIAPALPPAFLLCGFSFGGYVAMALLEALPDRVHGLALVGSGPWDDPLASRPMREAAIEKAESGGYVELATAGAAHALHADNVDDPTIRAIRAQMIADYGAAAFVAHTRAAMTRPDRTPLLDGFSLPLLLAAGESDPLAPAARLVAIAERARRATVTIVPRAGHLLPLEQPDALAMALLAWRRAASNGDR